MTSYAERGIERRLEQRPHRWLYRAVGPWRDREDQAEADGALLETIPNAERVVVKRLPPQH